MLAEIILKAAGMNKEQEMEYYPRPSSAGPQKCLRQQVYKALGITGVPVGDRFILILDDSSWHEELTADWINKTTFKLHSRQMRVNCGTTIHKGQPFQVEGSIDGIITDVMNIDRLWEHKALNHFTFEMYAKGEEVPLDYFTQVALYIVGLQKTNPDIHEACLLIKNKNTSAYMEYLLDYDAENDLMLIQSITLSSGVQVAPKQPVYVGLYKAAFERFAEIESYAQKKTLPVRQYPPGSWQCDYCPYQKKCWEGVQAEMKAGSELVPLEGEIAALAVRYLILSQEISNREKETDEIKLSLRNWILEKKTQKAAGEGVQIKLNYQTRKSLNKETIPPEILAAAMEEKTVEMMKISKLATN